ncbi:MAG: condensation domain-containing protein [Steroidobacteraceae bacterium]
MYPASSTEQGTRPESESQGHVDTAPYTDFPCSVAQERFWLLDRLEPGNPSYNVAVRWRLEGRISTSLLEEAWREIIARHEILRTQFLETDGKPVQRVAAQVAFKLAEIDLTTLSVEARAAEGDNIGLLEARAPFDLSDGPLLRVLVLRYSPTEAIILVTTHQIVSDGWSIGVMAREMGTIYAALTRQEPSPLEPLAIQYGDYASWQLEWLRQRGTEAETAYWARQLAGVRPFEVVPDRPRPAIPTTNGTIVSLVLPRDLTQKMQALSAASGVTMFATAVSALCATLARYTGKNEVVLGTQVSDRDQVELEPMIGQFVNSLILRTNLQGDPSFSTLLERVSTTISDALENRHIPIERLLDMVKAGRGGSTSPAVSINFIFQRTFIEGRNYGDFTLVDMPSLVAGAIYDLNFFMVERPDGWRFSCQFNTDQFEADTATRLLGYVADAIASVVENPERAVSQLRLGDSSDLSRPGNPFEQESPTLPALTVGGQFARHARRTPNAIALMDGDRKLTYAQLYAASLRLAAVLKSRGIGPDNRVAIALEPSIERTTAILATLVLGAAYVPLNAADPPHLLEHLLTASGAQAAFMNEAEAQSINTSAIVLTGYRDDASGEALELPFQTFSESAAIVWFSVRNPLSPEAVTMSHAGLMNTCESLGRRIGMTHTDVVAALCTATPEIGPVDTIMPLLCGACSVIVPRTDIGIATRAAKLVTQARATFIYAESVTWIQLLGTLLPTQRIRAALCPRDAMDLDLATRIGAVAEKFWALHGYPQTGGCTSAQLVRQPFDLRFLGSALDNVQLIILDKHRNVPPIGAVGELHAAGCAVAADDGVHRRLLFPTGDTARRTADGTIEIVDEDPQRFALDGQTFSATALTSALLTYPEVVEAAVNARPAARGLRLFITWKPGLDPSRSAESIQARIAAEWPRAAQPRAILATESLPRAIDGSIDFRRLESEQRASVLNPHDAVARDPKMEQTLVAIWAELLKLDSIDPNANFFELGGHSLLAARMLGRVEGEFGRRITLAALFRSPTVRGLSRLLHSDSRSFDFRQVVKLQAGGSKPTLIAINNTGVYYLLAKRLGADQPVTSLQLFDPANKRSDLPDTLEAIAAEYVKLIRRVQPHAPYILMGWCVAGTLAFEVARQLEAENHPVAHLFLVDSWIPGYFNRQPAVRGLIGNYTLRWQLMADDWRSWRMGRLTPSQFLASRPTLRRLLPDSWSGTVSASDQQGATQATYDRWLLEHLQSCNARYEPKPFHGHISLIRSTREPTGWLFDPNAGWGAFATQGVDMTLVEGNHFTMFQEPGVSQMAAAMMQRIGAATVPVAAKVSPDRTARSEAVAESKQPD